jgi:hypothetical protein
MVILRVRIKRLKKNYFETQTNAQNNKRQNLSTKTSAIWGIFLPPLTGHKFLLYFYSGRG